MTWKPDYATGATLEDFVRANTGDPYVATYATAASRAVDGFCNRQFGQLAAAATFTYDATNAVRLNNGRYLLEIDDVQDLTGLTVTVNGTAVAAGATGYLMHERDAIAKGYPHTAISLRDCPQGDVAVFAKFGWAAVPSSVVGATWLQVNRWHVRRESPYGTAGAPSEGSEVRLTAVLDPDVRAILAGAGVVRKRMPR